MSDLSCHTTHDAYGAQWLLPSALWLKRLPQWAIAGVLAGGIIATGAIWTGEKIHRPECLVDSFGPCSTAEPTAPDPDPAVEGANIPNSDWVQTASSDRVPLRPLAAVQGQ